MKEISITFKIEDHDDEASARRAMDADRMHAAFYEISQEIFRPARKHGYSDPGLIKAFADGEHGKDELVGALEEKFHEILP